MRKSTIGVGLLAGLGLLAISQTSSAFTTGIACDFTTESFGTGTGQPGNTNLADASCTATGSTGNVLFQVPTGPYSVGTGLIEPFLTIQVGGNETDEAGFNTDTKVQKTNDANGDPLDIKRTGQTGNEGFTNSLQLGVIPQVTFNNVLYREILLDLNQDGGGGEHLSLDVIRLFMGDGTGNLADTYTGVSADFDTSGIVKQGATSLNLIWSLDYGQTNQTILLDYKVCDVGLLGACPKGSGRTYDIRYLIPDALFAGYDATDYFVMYTTFGWQGCDGTVGTNGKCVGRTFTTNDGFEEWAIRKNVECPITDPACNPNETPEPGSLALLGLGLLGLGMTRRRNVPAG